jgi:putative ATP-binding cassette transporter
MVGPAYLRGDAEFGAISQASFAFQIIFNSLTLIMTKLDAFSSLAVHVSRLRELEAAISASHAEAVEDTIDLFEFDAKDDQVLVVRDMTLRTPFRKGCPQETLVRNLTLHLAGGQSMLIAGTSGIGKSSLLRGVAGLWTAGLGSVQRCSGSAVFFMPQKPYMYLGTLREQLLYPDIERLDISRNTLKEVLREVNLGYLVDRYSMDATHEWANTLSLGEQQRINFARMLLRPNLKLALLDEGTSACDASNEAYLYDLLKKRVHSFVSVGHRPNLRKYHTHALWLYRQTERERQVSQEVDDTASEVSGTSRNAQGISKPIVASFLPMQQFEKVGAMSAIPEG